MIQDEEARSIGRPVTIQEMKETLIQFEKDKIPSPDGWTTEFFVGFFDLFGDDLLKFVEESRICGYVLRDLNATFIALIPMSIHPKSFKDFKLISLCNVVYKLISKVIANRLEPFPSSGISKEKFGFLYLDFLSSGISKEPFLSSL